MKSTTIFFWTLAISGNALAGTHQWTSEWAQGVSEYMVDDGNGNELNISCPNDTDSSTTAFATVAGKQISSSDDVGFDVIIDGVTYSNPFFTDCRACSNAFPAFWSALRKTKNLQISNGVKTVKLPTANLAKILLSLNSPENFCKSAW